MQHANKLQTVRKSRSMTMRRKPGQIIAAAPVEAVLRRRQDDGAAAGGAVAKRAFDAMMDMKKIDVPKIERVRLG